MRSLALMVFMTLSGCAGLPSGPSVMVLPGNGRDFNAFSIDDQTCRQYALAQCGGKSPNASAAETGLASAAIGTAVGAAAGAAFGGAPGAAIGAGAGLIGGSAVGTGMGYQSGLSQQQRYDHAYIQCMYGHGHQVPVNGIIMNPAPSYPTNNRSSSGVPLPPASSSSLPLPPSGSSPTGGTSNVRLSLPPPP